MAKDNDGKAPATAAAGPTTNAARDWSQTLFLPKTDFPMRAGLPQMEPKLLEHWQKIDVYGQLRAKSTKEKRAKFTLHDGPPYANGNIHIGHALNKILKDLVTRSKQMLGFDSNYVPGWVDNAVSAVPGVQGCTVNLTFDPPWNQSRMSEEAKLAVGMF